MENQMAIEVEELIKRLNGWRQEVLFIGDGIPVYRERLDKELKIPHFYAPANMSRQRAASVGALGIKYFRQGKTETAMEHQPNYLRVSQAERERAEREKAKGSV